MKKNKKKFGSFYSMSPMKMYPNPGGPESIGRFNHATGDAIGVGTSGTGGTSSGATSGGMGESLQEDYLNPRQLEQARQHIARCCQIASGGIWLDTNGNFHIYNVPEQDARRIVVRLQQDPQINSVYSTPGRYDFSHFNQFMQPTQQRNISGQFDITSLNEDIGDAFDTLKQRAKGAIQAKKDNYKIEDLVARTLYKNFFKKNPTLFIFDSTNTYPLSKLEDWIRTCIGKKARIYSGKYDILGYNSDGLNTNQKEYLSKLAASLGQVFVLPSTDQKKNKPFMINDFTDFCAQYERFLSQFKGGDIGKGLKSFCNTDPVSPKFVLLLYYYLKTHTHNNKFAEVNNQVRQIVKLYIYKNSTLKKDIEYIDNIRSNSLKKNTNPNLTTTQADQLSPNIISDLKYHKFFVCIVSSSEYQELLNSYKDLLDKCAIVNLVYDLDLKNKDSNDTEIKDEPENDSSDEVNQADATKVSSTFKGRLGKTDSLYANRPGGNSLNTGKGIRGVNGKNNLFASLQMNTGDNLMEDFELDNYWDYDDEGDYEFQHNYDQQIDYILDDLDNRLSWIVLDGMCSKPILVNNEIIIDYDTEPEVRKAVNDIINDVCDKTSAQVIEDGYTTIIRF